MVRVPKLFVPERKALPAPVFSQPADAADIAAEGNAGGIGDREIDGRGEIEGSGNRVTAAGDLDQGVNAVGIAGVIDGERSADP